MGQHVHDESESASGGDHLHRWDAARMARHLKDVHGFVAPMSWDLGRLHLHHLEDHQGPGPSTPQPEEAPVPIEHEHDDVTTLHASWSKSMLREHLEAVHGLDLEVTEGHDGLKDTHRLLHPENGQPIQTCGEVNPEHPDLICQYEAGHDRLKDPGGPNPIRGTFDHGDPVKGVWWENTEEYEARQLFLAEHPGGDWDDLQQETRDYWRTQNRLRKEKSQVKAVSTDPSPAKDQDAGRRQIEVDRIICTMAGISFDTVWVLDESLSLRGAMRSAYGQQAQRVWAALERGGLGFHEAIDQAVSQERALVMDMEETNNGLRRELARAIEERDEARGEVTTARRLQLAAENDRDRTTESLAREHERAERLMAERDRLSGQLAESRRALAEGRSALRTFIRNFRQEDWSWSLAVHGTTWALARPEKIAQSLEEAVLGERVSTSVPVGIDCTEAHLGLATTGELLEEITARIRTDVAGKGLDYRTVDGD